MHGFAMYFSIYVTYAFRSLKVHRDTWQKILRQRRQKAHQSHQDSSATSLEATADGASSAQSGSNLYEKLFGIF